MPQQFRGYDRLKQRTTLHRHTNGIEDVFARRTFEQITIGSGFQRGDDALVVIKSSEDYNTRAEAVSLTRVQSQVLAQTTNGFNSIHDRHFEVEQKDIGLQFQCQMQSFITTGSLLWSSDHFEIRLSFKDSA